MTTTFPRPTKPIPLRFVFHDQQWPAVVSPASEMLVGGALGGGKSWLLRALAVAFANAIPGLIVFVVRRTFGEVSVSASSPRENGKHLDFPIQRSRQSKTQPLLTLLVR